MGRIVEMPLPRLGETMEEGRIGQWFKQPGEKFRRGETLLEVESDKTTVEVPAAVGVAEITPAAFIDNPAGRPFAVQVYGAAPPLGCTAVDG